MAPPPAPSPVARVLVVEDERKIANALRDGLSAEGFDVVLEHSGDAAFFRLSTQAVDLVLLDVGLPDRSGLDVLRAVRARQVRTPVMVLTARDSVEQRVEGLDAGADDYLVKPFAFEELIARMRALLRRESAHTHATLTAADVVIDTVARRVERAGRPIDVTLREYQLLEYLVRHRGRPVSRESLARDVWQESVRSTTLDNVIDVSIARLRRKVDAEGVPLIQTIRGVGFMVATDAALMVAGTWWLAAGLDLGL